MSQNLNVRANQKVTLKLREAHKRRHREYEICVRKVYCTLLIDLE